jgi:hypothetical protein
MQKLLRVQRYQFRLQHRFQYLHKENLEVYESLETWLKKKLTELGESEATTERTVSSDKLRPSKSNGQEKSENQSNLRYGR